MNRVSEEDPRRLAQAEAKKIAGLSREQLDVYGKKSEEVVTPTGRRFRVKSIAFCHSRGAQG